ncbi:MAG: hypothetical protein RID15_06705 [Marinovum algicola]|jgi:hypothetical protein|uniref:Uncharacterized protein n=1 Tax=Marinovum algicola TaxID=42444 RepID=A0A975WD48_9RHOB|nr:MULTISPECIES: hypothetical protein [Marinovum]MDD9739662.1 hypothetical protein [Marinovum sp. SP66]SEJ97799.1 hypothetical protein SAMN04487940_11624 [Marinovum algicola]SLN70037.1 hypothetical protein MAA5396_03831 [Marinovum algicola]
MILVLLLLSIALGGACGLTAFLCDYGMFQSLVIYAVAGQLPFLLAPLMGPMLGIFTPSEPDRTQAYHPGFAPLEAR